MLETVRHRVLGWWSRLVSRHPYTVLAVAGAVALGCIVYAIVALEFQADRNKLISDRLEWNRYFQTWQRTFPGFNDVYVVVDTWQEGRGDSLQSRAAARNFVQELGLALRDLSETEEVVWRPRFGPRSIRLAPMDRFEQSLDEVRQSETLLSAPTPGKFLEQATGQMGGFAGGGGIDEARIARGLEEFAGILQGFAKALNRPAPDNLADVEPLPVNVDSSGQWQYLTSENDRLLFIRITPRIEEGKINALSRSIAAIRRVTDDHKAKHPELSVGLTGIDVVESDEGDIVARDSLFSSIVAFTLIAIVLVLAFHSFRTPLIALGSLLVAIAWSFGFLTLVIGHLQMISVVFTVILLGLGVAYAIHIASRFEMVRHQFAEGADGFAHALQDTLERVGPGVVTGALTTAAAFYTTQFTDYDGVAEMGLIAAAGVILCLVSMFAVFPALLRILKPTQHHIKRLEERPIHLFEESWIAPFVRRPRTTLAVVAGVTIATSVMASQLKFDFSLLNLQPVGVESVDWQNKIAEDGGQSIYFAVSICDSLEQAKERTEAFRKLDVVASIRGIGLLFPEQEQEKIERMKDTRQDLQPHLNEALQTPPEKVTDHGGLLEQLKAIDEKLAPFMLGRIVYPEAISNAMVDVERAIKDALKTAEELNDNERQRRLAAVTVAYRKWRREMAQTIDQTLSTSPLTLDDLPREVLDPYIGEREPMKGKVAVEVHPAPPGPDPLNHAFLPKFIEAAEQIDPQVTGPMPQIYRSGVLILDSYRWAGMYALVAVFVLLVLDFWRFDDALLALLPVFVGVAVTFGVLWLVGVPINLANIIVLPLMFGIGVDSGVHVLHRYRQNPDESPPGLTHGTGKGIMITSLTTILGFGALVIANHRGIRSLGIVLALGVTFTLLASLFVMPPLLKVFQQRKPRPTHERYEDDLPDRAEE